MPEGDLQAPWARPLALGGIRLPNRLAFAPMSGVSTLAARLIAREAGAGLTFTETLSARALVSGRGPARAKLATLPEEDRLAVQLFGSDAAVLGEACRHLADAGFSWVDLNVGCPVPKFIRQGAGAALLREPAKLAGIVKAMRAAFPGVLSVKLRAGWDARHRNAPEVAAALAGEGVELVTIHGRTRAQQYRGRADRALMAEVVAAIPALPVFANGDVRSASDVESLIRETGAAGVMIGRGAVGNPWVFEAALARSAKRGREGAPAAEERLRTLERHVALVARAADDPATRVRELRRYAAAYSRGLPGGKRFRVQAMATEHPDALVALARDFLAEAALGAAA